MSYLQYELLNIGMLIWFVIGTVVIISVIIFDFMKHRKSGQRTSVKGRQ
jgi:hypothetical protein